MSTPRLCASLRWKGFYGRVFRDADDLARELASSDVPFTCLQTCQPWGPDDDLVEPARCQPDRGCFERSARDPSPRTPSLS